MLSHPGPLLALLLTSASAVLVASEPAAAQAGTCPSGFHMVGGRCLRDPIKPPVPPPAQTPPPATK